MWFEECFPRGETRAFAGAVKEAIAYAEVKKGLNRAEGIAGYPYDLQLDARSPHPTTGQHWG